MPESPTKISSKRAASPTKSTSTGSFLSVPNGAQKRAATSPVRKMVTPFKRSPTKIDNSSVPEVREQARQVLEKFLQRSLSENNAGRGSAVRKYYKEGADLKKIKEHGNSSTADELSSPTEKRGSYVAAVSEDSSGKNSERKHSTGSISSQKSHSMTVTKAEKSVIAEQIKARKKSLKKGLGESLSPTDTDHGEFTPNSTGASRSADQLERETSDDEESVQQGRRKKSKFAKAKARIRDSFLRKQRELGSPVKVLSRHGSAKARTPSEVVCTAQSIASSEKVPVKDKNLPGIEGTSVPENHDSAPMRGSTDLDDDSPTAGYNRTIHANSSPDGLNRINQQEKKTKTSFWDWFRPAKRKSKQKERQKSRSLDALTHPSYTVQNAKFNRVFSDEGPQTRSGNGLHKKHSLSGRCSFSGKTENGVDRTRLKLNLRVNRPRTPEASDQKRVLPSDVVDDAVASDHVDAESPFDIPFHERTEAEKDEVYDLVASRLAEIASNYGRDDGSIPKVGDASRTAEAAADPAAQTTLAKDIAGILRNAGDKQAGANGNEKIEQIMVNAVKTAGYQKFKRELKRQMNSEPNLQQLAWFFDATKGAMQLAGVTGKIALKVKEFSLHYFEDKFASWIIDRGGWDSMLSDEDGTGDGEGIALE